VQLQGTGVSPGVAIGPALVLRRDAPTVFRISLGDADVESELQRLATAVEASRGQLQAIKERLAGELGSPHAYIFEAQLLMLDDPLLLDRTVAIVREERVNAEWALRTVAEQLHVFFEQLEDAYLKEKTSDLDDVLGRVQLNLSGGEGAPSLSRLPEPVVLVADDLSPSEAATLDWQKVRALAIAAGSRTYHTALLARSLGIPAVVGLGDATERVPPGALLAVDGASGRVVVDPVAGELDEFRRAEARERDEESRLQQTRGLPACTRDGVVVRLQANVEFPAEAATALLYGAEGIGLFRSEYLLGRSRGWPSEEEQIDVYRRLIEQMRPHPVTVRTWDVGAGELGPVGASSLNPALGERALRLLPRTPEPFRRQIRALLRAAVHGPLRIVFPFVSGPEDLAVGLELVESAAAELRREGLAFAPDVPIGLNLEVPSAAATADLLARRVDFFSVGTNDLIQYLLAVDRADPRVAAHYQPLHPAVLRTLRQIARVGEETGIPIGVCGEMAADPLQALFLLGIGIRELSMSPSSIPRVKEAVRRVDAARAREAAHRSLELATAQEVESFLRQRLGEALAGVSPATGEMP
jgi:phosphoenolpyruvate-protein phosphotransferase (PTS system enzyme I)